MKLSVWILNFPTLTKRGVDLKVLSGKLVKIVRGNIGGLIFRNGHFGGGNLDQLPHRYDGTKTSLQRLMKVPRHVQKFFYTCVKPHSLWSWYA